MLFWDFIFVFCLHAYARTLLMARYRQQKPHVAIHGAPHHDKLFWLRSASMSMLPWAVTLFSLLVVLARVDLFLLILLCMVLRIAAGTAGTISRKVRAQALKPVLLLRSICTACHGLATAYRACNAAEMTRFSHHET
jgi:hypothetical protein